MTWTPELVIGVLANIATAIIGTALLLLVLGPSPRTANTYLFALIMLLFAGTGLFGLGAYFSQRLEYDPREPVYVGTTLYAVGTVLLFLFSARFAHVQPRITWALTGLGLLLVLYLMPPLWGDNVYTDFEPAASGAHYNYKLASGGLPGLVLLGVFQALSIAVLYRFGDERAHLLAVAPGILLVAMLLFLVPLFDGFPKNALAISISSLYIARVVMQYQLFNPLAELNTQLAATNQELAKANTRLTLANTQLAEASQLKSQFLANMSHELRTPLNSIIGYTELILEGTYGSLTDVQTDRLQKVVRNGRSLLSLINDILDLSKIEAGRLELSVTPVNLGEIIDSVIASTELLTEKTHLTVVRAYANLPPVLADPGRARQILMNLINNAAKFTHVGSITVRGETDRSTGTVRVAVIDTGIGIAQDAQAFIFDEFRQVDGTATRQYEGTGLGLAITKRLVEMQGGTIWVDSTAGKGSTFIFSLPIAEARPPEPAARPAEIVAPGHVGPVAVVIDDSPEATQLIRDTLTSDGYHVLEAHSGPAGIELAQRVRPDVITLDIMMPDMNGWSVLEALRADSRTASIPVVVVSIVENRPVSLDVFANGYVAKPVDRARLLDLVRMLARGGPTTQPILVVEDNPQDREILCTILAAEHLNVIPAAGGQEAIEWLRNNTPVLVVLDLMLPDASGFDVLSLIRQQPTTASVPVIVVSAKDLTADEHAFLATRLAALIRKDGLRPQDLLQRVRTSLGT